MEKIDVLIFIEHKDREMDGTIHFVEAIQEKKVLSIVIANIEYGFFDAFIKYDPRLVCLPYCRGLKNHIANAFYSRNPKTLFLNLNYEQIYNPTTIKLKKPQDDFAKKVLFHIAWGNQFKDYLINNGVDERRISITGKPEIYFLQKMYDESRDIIKANISKQFSIPMEFKWCFIPLNDGTAFMSEERIIANIKQGKSTEATLESHRIGINLVRHLLDDICRYLKEHNDVVFILRPHPGISIEKYSKLMSEMNLGQPHKLYFIRDFSVKEWLCCADYCISNWSTVILDASAIGVRTCVFEPEKLPDFLDAPWIEIFEKIKTYEEFEEYFAVANDYRVSNNYINNYVDTTLNPIEEISNTIISVLDKQNETSSLHKRTTHLKEIPHLLRSKIRTATRGTVFENLLKTNRIAYDYFDEIKMLGS